MEYGLILAIALTIIIVIADAISPEIGAFIEDIGENINSWFN